MSSRLAYASAFALLAAGLAVAVTGNAQVTPPACPVGGFDVCFPNLDAGAPSAACDAADAAAPAIDACLGNICGGVANEPQPGFFSYCCAAGGSVRYDDFCAFVVQSTCPAVATECADRCPPLALLTGSVALAPPPEACLPSYPTFINEVCDADPFCCTTSWDVICAGAALEASSAL